MQDQQGLNWKHLQQLFNISDTRDAFYDLADEGIDLPRPFRRPNGYRYWSYDSLPAIANYYGPPLSKPVSGLAPVINFYLSKGGGSHKTTDAYNMACYLGMMGKKVLILGLDFQLNISKKFDIDNSIYKIKETGEYYRGIYEVLAEKVPVEDVVIETSMPNVYLIPESSNLVKLEVWLVGQVRREEKLKRALEPLRNFFDAIIIDNNPSWSQLSISSLCACDINIASIGLDANTNEALPQFFETLEVAGVMPRDLLLTPGMDEGTALKKQTKEFLKKSYGNMVATSSVRKSVIVDEANAIHLPVFLYKPKEKVAEDYMKVCEEIWDRSVLACDSNAGEKRISH